MRTGAGILALALAACASPQPADSTPVTPPGSSPPTTSTPTVASSTTTGPVTTTTFSTIPPERLEVEVFAVPDGARPHDVAPAADGGVWFTAQGSGHLGLLDPATGESTMVPLGRGSRPHGVVVGPDGVAWVTDSGLNAMVSVEPDSLDVTVHPLPADRSGVNLNTAAFDGSGRLWFTGQSGVYGYLDPADGTMEVFDAPGGRGPYGITGTPEGVVWYASLAGSHIARVELDSSATVVQPPTPGQGARRIWSDSSGRLWVSEWNSGDLSRHDPSTGEWASWPLPGEGAAPYAVFVDDTDIVWLSDFGSNTLVRFDPSTELFTSIPLPHQPGEVRQILGRPGEVWGAESAADALVLVRTR